MTLTLARWPACAASSLRIAACGRRVKVSRRLVLLRLALGARVNRFSVHHELGRIENDDVDHDVERVGPGRAVTMPGFDTFGVDGDSLASSAAPMVDSFR